MVTVVFGLPLLSTATLLIASRVASPRTSWPKIVWLKSSSRCGPSVMKNWLEFVSLPLLAKASWPVPLKMVLALNSSLNVASCPPVPSPLGSPPWMTKLLTIRWNVRPL